MTTEKCYRKCDKRKGKPKRSFCGEQLTVQKTTRNHHGVVNNDDFSTKLLEAFLKTNKLTKGEWSAHVGIVFFQGIYNFTCISNFACCCNKNKTMSV